MDSFLEEALRAFGAARPWQMVGEGMFFDVVRGEGTTPFAMVCVLGRRLPHRGFAMFTDRAACERFVAELATREARLPRAPGTYALSGGPLVGGRPRLLVVAPNGRASDVPNGPGTHGTRLLLAAIARGVCTAVQRRRESGRWTGIAVRAPTSEERPLFEIKAPAMGNARHRQIVRPLSPPGAAP